MPKSCLSVYVERFCECYKNTDKVVSKASKNNFCSRNIIIKYQMPVCLSVCLSICLSVCLSVCLCGMLLSTQKEKQTTHWGGGQNFTPMRTNSKWKGTDGTIIRNKMSVCLCGTLYLGMKKELFWIFWPFLLILFMIHHQVEISSRFVRPRNHTAWSRVLSFKPV